MHALLIRKWLATAIRHNAHLPRCAGETFLIAGFNSPAKECILNPRSREAMPKYIRCGRGSRWPAWTSYFWELARPTLPRQEELRLWFCVRVRKRKVLRLCCTKRTRSYSRHQYRYTSEWCSVWEVTNGKGSSWHS